MSDEKDVVPAQPKTNEKEEGFFTGKLQWWQILLGLIFVGYLVYGKYEENVARSNNPPVSAPAPGK